MIGDVLFAFLYTSAILQKSLLSQKKKKKKKKKKERICSQGWPNYFLWQQNPFKKGDKNMRVVSSENETIPLKIAFIL